MMEIPDRKLNDGNSIPAIGFGCFPWGGADSETMVRSALDAGYRLLDTALNYRNEEEVGRVVASSGLTREEILVTTKLPGRYQASPQVAGALRAVPGVIDVQIN
jgi:2,5-diketo-D-gluconate reductase A